MRFTIKRGTPPESRNGVDGHADTFTPGGTPSTNFIVHPVPERSCKRLICSLLPYTLSRASVWPRILARLRERRPDLFGTLSALLRRNTRVLLAAQSSPFHSVVSLIILGVTKLRRHQPVS